MSDTAAPRPDDSESPPRELSISVFLHGLAGMSVAAIAGIAWERHGHVPGFVCTLVLLVLGLAITRPFANEQRRLSKYVAPIRVILLVLFGAYLLLFERTWTWIGVAMRHGETSVSVKWVYLAGLAGFIAGSLLVNSRARAWMRTGFRGMLASAARFVAERLHRFAASVADNPEELVDLLQSTERVSQVRPQASDRKPDRGEQAA